jgi:glutathione S-transferase
MSRLRIYGIPRTRAFRVIWMAKELGLDYENLPIETGPRGARRPEYLAINPNGRLPSIDDDGFIMWESQAINLYLAKKHSTRRALSGHARGRGANAGSGACGRPTRSSARSTSGRCMACACRNPSATPR